MTTNPESLLAEVFGVLSAIPIGEFPGATYREKEATAVRCLNALKSEMDATRPAHPAQPGRNVFCNKCGFHGVAFGSTHLRPSDGEPCNYEAVPLPQPGREEVGAAVEKAIRKAIPDVHILISDGFYDDAAAVLANAALAAEPLLARQDVRPEAEPVACADNFNGSTAHLLDCIDAFLDLTDDKAFVPHNLDKGSHAYRLLVAARVRLEASIQSEAKTAAALVNALADNAHPATLPTEPASVREERLREALRNIDEKASIHSSTLALEVTNIARAALSTLEPKL